MRRHKRRQASQDELTASPPWQTAAANARLRLMDTVNPAPGESAGTRLETEAEQQRRLAWEAKGIARARFGRSRASGRFGQGKGLDRQHRGR
jgi:hypothetical protein